MYTSASPSSAPISTPTGLIPPSPRSGGPNKRKIIGAGKNKRCWRRLLNHALESPRRPHAIQTRTNFRRRGEQNATTAGMEGGPKNKPQTGAAGQPRAFTLAAPRRPRALTAP
eukprot:9466886-Pyramimonas_sp.AAC.2